MNTDYRRSEGGVGTPSFQKVNLRKGYYAVRWDFQEGETEGIVNYMETVFDHLPTKDEVRDVINQYYNEIIDAKILTGFTWNDTSVWLSTENQFNYKAAFDLAVQTGGTSLPVTFKFGTEDEPVYHEFTTVEDIQDFYTKAMKYVQDTLAEGWKIKDNINYSDYEID